MMLSGPAADLLRDELTVLDGATAVDHVEAPVVAWRNGHAELVGHQTSMKADDGLRANAV